MRTKKQNGWEEIYSEENNTKKRWPPYVILKPRYSTIYFSFRLTAEFFGTFNRVRIRYNRKANILAFTPTSDIKHSYKISDNNKTIKAKNVFNRIAIPFTENRSYLVRYNPEARWLEIDLEEAV